MKPVFSGKVERGMLKLDAPEAFRAHYLRFEGKPVDVTCERMILERSHPQNRYYWGVVLKMLATETGHTVDEMHEFCKLKFNAKYVQIVNKETGENEDLTIGASTTKLTTISFGEYIEQIKMWAATFLSLSIPEPNEVEV